jgi:hypothetical protein
MTDPQPITIPGASVVLYRDGPSHDGRKTAAIGKFACDTAEAGRQLLDDIIALLRKEAFGAVIGPMEGDTWHSYRLVS